jgi:hypothetical protein
MSVELENAALVPTLSSVLAIHCSAELLRRCAEAAARAGISARECELATMGREATRRRPLAMIVPSYLHEFDPTEFDALARDIGAELLVVDEAVGQAELDELIVGAARSRARSSRAAEGRYSVVGGCATEVTQRAAPTTTCVRLRVARAAQGDVAPRGSRAG